MPSFSRGSISAARSTKRRRFERWAKSSSTSSRIWERSPVARRQGCAGELVGVDQIGQDEERQLRRVPCEQRNRGAREGQIVRDERELVAGLRTELRHALGTQPARHRMEARRSRARLRLARHPRENLVVSGADASPEASLSGPVTKYEAACHVNPSREAPGRRFSVSVFRNGVDGSGRPESKWEV